MTVSPQQSSSVKRIYYLNGRITRVTRDIAVLDYVGIPLQAEAEL
jgi:hypothetical protein